MLERQREALVKAQLDGKYNGRVPTVRRQAAEIARLRAGGLTPTDIAIRLRIGRASVYRVLAMVNLRPRDLRDETRHGTEPLEMAAGTGTLTP
jgi:DNA invertase Pin-like site-specific DNA recombinase